MHKDSTSENAWLLSLRLWKNAPHPEFCFIYVENSESEYPVSIDGKLVLFTFDSIKKILANFEISFIPSVIYEIDIYTIVQAIGNMSEDNDERILHSLNYLFETESQLKKRKYDRQVKSFLNHLTFDRSVEKFFNYNTLIGPQLMINKIHRAVEAMLCNAIFVVNDNYSMDIFTEDIISSLRNQTDS